MGGAAADRCAGGDPRRSRRAAVEFTHTAGVSAAWGRLALEPATGDGMSASSPARAGLAVDRCAGGAVIGHS